MGPAGLEPATYRL